MKSLRTKLLLSILIITLLPVYPLYHLVKNFFSQSLEVGFNAKVEHALENASLFSQKIFADFRGETRLLGEALANSVQSHRLLRTPQIGNFDFTGFEKRFGPFLVIFYDKESSRLQEYNSTREIYPQVTEDELAGVLGSNEPQFINPDLEPAYVSLFVPVKRNKERLGSLVVMRPAPKHFAEQSREIIEVNQMFKAIGVLRGDLESSFIAAFFTIYLLFVVLALVLGLYFSRRLSKPLMALAEGTQKVAEGNLDYRMSVSSNDEVGQLVRAFNVMITRVKEKQQQVVELEKKAAWREMARILAHEIKNPLTPIQLMIQQLRDQYKGDDQIYTEVLNECTEIITDEIGTLQNLVRSFSEFARMPEMQKELMNLNEMIRDVVKLYSDPHIELELDTKIPQLFLDEQQFRRIFKNFIENSRAAIAQKGQGSITVRTALENGSAVIRFSDTGAGIKNDVLQRIFEPHYSTKKHGMGLGLAIVKRIVHEHGGTITVSSEEGKWTEFVIRLERNNIQ
ncbi:MAG: HAMP domain-containing protein [Deferribacteres bacterium]|nr:HAMP domain-containing protein [candidate division KSB1 bacterium]MCB9502204.1 HAMP domain-containing protein [Deferribacteres bacterium]